MLENCQWDIYKQGTRICFLSDLWKIVTRVPVFVISFFAINTLVGFKAFSQVLQVCSCVGKCRLKGHRGPIGLITCKKFVLNIVVVCFLFIIVKNFLFL